MTILDEDDGVIGGGVVMRILMGRTHDEEPDDHRKDADRIDAVWDRDDDQEYMCTVLIDSSANQIVT